MSTLDGVPQQTAKRDDDAFVTMFPAWHRQDNLRGLVIDPQAPDAESLLVSYVYVYRNMQLWEAAMSTKDFIPEISFQLWPIEGHLGIMLLIPDNLE